MNWALFGAVAGLGMLGVIFLCAIVWVACHVDRVFGYTSSLICIAVMSIIVAAGIIGLIG